MSETCQDGKFTNTSESTVQSLFVALVAQLVEFLTEVFSEHFFAPAVRAKSNNACMPRAFSEIRAFQNSFCHPK